MAPIAHDRSKEGKNGCYRVCIGAVASKIRKRESDGMKQGSSFGQAERRPPEDRLPATP